MATFVSGLELTQILVVSYLVMMHPGRNYQLHGTIACNRESRESLAKGAT